MRSYPYTPDVVVLRRLAGSSRRMMGLSWRTVNEGRARIHSVADGVDGCWEVASYSWFFEEPAWESEFVEALRHAGLLVDAAVRTMTSGAWPNYTALAFGVTARVIGDRDAAAAVAWHAADPAGLEAEAPVRSFELLVTRAVTSVLAGHDSAATGFTGQIAGLPAGEEANSVQGEALTAMVNALVAGDQQGLDVAARSRSERRMELARRSAQNRVKWMNLVDRTVLAVMVEASSRGLQATPGLPDVPVELVELAVATAQG